MAMKRLLWRKVSSISLSSINVVSRPDNVAMIRLLGVSIKHIEKTDMNSFTRFVIVDSQPGHNEAFSKIKADVVIDHHPDTNVRASFHDIRPNYGATASIMTEYLRAARLILESDMLETFRQSSRFIAMALAMASGSALNTTST